MPAKLNFDQAASQWDFNPVRLKLAADVAAAIAANAALDQGLRVLDFGCGTGLLTLNLKPLVGEVVGLDTSRGMLDELEAKLAAQNIGGVSTVCAELNSARLEPGFDLIVSSMALHHVEDTAGLLAEFMRLLKPGGRIALADLDLDGGRFHDDATGVYHNGFDRDELAGLIRAAGFEDVRVVTAASVHKPAGGEMAEFTVMLACAQRPV